MSNIDRPGPSGFERILNEGFLQKKIDTDVNYARTMVSLFSILMAVPIFCIDRYSMGAVGWLFLVVIVFFSLFGLWQATELIRLASKVFRVAAQDQEAATIIRTLRAANPGDGKPVEVIPFSTFNANIISDMHNKSLDLKWYFFLSLGVSILLIAGEGVCKSL